MLQKHLQSALQHELSFSSLSDLDSPPTDLGSIKMTRPTRIHLALLTTLVIASPAVSGPAERAPLTDWRDCRSVPFAARAVDDGFETVWLDYGLPRQRGFDDHLAAADSGRGSNVPLGDLADWTGPAQLEVVPDGRGSLAAVWIETADDPPTGHFIRVLASPANQSVLLGELNPFLVSESRTRVEPLGDGRLLIWFDFHDEAFVVDEHDVVQRVGLGNIGRSLQLAVDPDDDSLLAAWIQDLPTSPPSFSLTVERRTLAGTLVERVFEELFLGAPSEMRLAVPRHGGALVTWNEWTSVVIHEVGNDLPPQRFASVDGGGIVEDLAIIHDAEGNALVTWLQAGRLVLQRRSADGMLSGPAFYEPIAEDGSFLPPHPVALGAGRAAIVANETIPFILGAPPPCGGDTSGLYARSTSLAAPTELLLQEGRFRVRVDWQAPQAGTSGQGEAVIGTEQSGSFTFFESGNKEVEVKILDGRVINGKYWLFAAGLSDVAYQIVVTDQRTGAIRVYENPAGSNGNFIDTAAFD